MSKAYVARKSELDTEVTTRGNADTALSGRVTALEGVDNATQTELNAAVSTEITARNAAITTAVNAEAGIRDSTDDGLADRLVALEAAPGIVVSETEPAGPAIWFEVDGEGALQAIWSVTA